MEVITMESEAFKNLMKRFDQLEEKMKYYSPKAQMEDEYVDVQGACKLIGVSRRTLFTYLEREEIVYFKYNRKLRFHINDIKAFLEKKKKVVAGSIF
jgi:phage antirepressor YoqD-like protein